MQKPLTLYAIEAIGKNGEKSLCFKQKNNLYFVFGPRKDKKYKNPPPPTFFNSRLEAKSALEKITNVSDATLKKKFYTVAVIARTKIVKTEIYF